MLLDHNVEAGVLPVLASEDRAHSSGGAGSYG